MAFLNALGRVSRQGQWRFRHVLRVADATGRVDPTPGGLIALERVSAAVLTVTKRSPSARRTRDCAPPALASASLADGRLKLFSPGRIEALFPDGWAAEAEPGLYDVRLTLTIGPETALVLDEPIQIA